MSSQRELTFKPSCLHQILVLPKKMMKLIMEKVNFLCDNPQADGKLKKSLKSYEDVYRIRAGDYRIFYSYGADWVKILAFRKRDERTYNKKGKQIRFEEPAAHPDDSSLDLEALDHQRDWEDSNMRIQKDPSSSSLPFKITANWLKKLGVSKEIMVPFIRCKTEEDLMELKVPHKIHQMVLDNIYPPSLKEAIQQPDLIVRDPKDLLRYRDGSLIDFLLKLDPEQEKIAQRALYGPALVKGGAGTGKSIVALYRIKAYLERPESTRKEKVLFTTYTRALQGVSKQLLAQLLSEQQIKQVKVMTVDKLVRQIVKDHRPLKKMENPGLAGRILKSILQSFQPTGKTVFDRKMLLRFLKKLSLEYILDEFKWIIQGRGIKSEREYLKTSRTGRGIPFGEKQRRCLWELYGIFKKNLSCEDCETFQGLRREALELVKQGKFEDQYDYVVIDEGQDLSPVALQLLAEIATTPKGIFLAMDINQSIYSRCYQWKDIHPRLKFRGRTTILKHNYRSTKQIDEAAFSLLPDGEGEVDHLESLHSGPKALLIRGVLDEEEPSWIARFLRQMSSYLKVKMGSAAVLVPQQKVGKYLAEALLEEGVEAQFFESNSLDLRSSKVKVMTLHTAKGLEFPLVVLGGFFEGTYPLPEEYADPGEYEEELCHHRRLLYVGMTRAMKALMLIEPANCQSEAILSLNRDFWNIQEV